MNATTQEIQNEKKDRKRGLIIAFFIQTALVLLAILPLINHLQNPEPKQSEFIVMDFTDFKPASKEGAKPQKVKNTVKKQQKKAKKAVPKAKPTPKPKPTTPPKPKKKVITTAEPNPPIKTPPTKTETPKKETPIEKPTPKDDAPAAPVEEAPEATTADEAPSTEASSDATDATAKDSGNGTGAKDNGKLDRGKNNGEVAGEGIFSRRVTYRADVKKITRKEGKIVVELCINRDGRVVYAKPVKDASTIKDNNVIRKAVNLTTKYKFERDPTAPKKQCGKLTYIFEIEEE